MSVSRPAITEGQYRRIQQINRKNGMQLFVDLHVAEAEKPKLYIALPHVLPPGVIPEGGSYTLDNLVTEVSGRRYITHVAKLPPPPAYRVARTEPIEGITLDIGIGESHPVRYERLFDNEDRYRGVRKLVADSRDSFDRIGAHIHVSSPDHGIADFGLGRTTLPLGQDIPSLDEAINAMHRLALVLRGELPDPTPQTAASGNLPSKELGHATLKEFALGFVEAAENFERPDLKDRTFKLVDTLVW